MGNHGERSRTTFNHGGTAPIPHRKRCFIDTKVTVFSIDKSTGRAKGQGRWIIMGARPHTSLLGK